MIMVLLVLAAAAACLFLKERIDKNMLEPDRNHAVASGTTPQGGAIEEMPYLLSYSPRAVALVSRAWKAYGRN
jgi:hypothetical protein